MRFHWATERSRILQSLRQGSYNLAPLQAITKADGTVIHLWHAPDALVLKAFYESIDQRLLLEKLAVYITDRFILNLLWQSMHRCVERGGLFRDITCGLPRGCPLSPLLGAFFLTELDEALEQKDVFYVRYIDDVLVMSRHRWGLRRAVKRLNALLNELKLEKHPDKTFIGRIEKGFDFLGYHFSRSGMQLAAKTIANAVEKMHRLYEQKTTAPERAAALDDYLRRWVRWATAGVTGQRSSNGRLPIVLSSAAPPG